MRVLPRGASRWDVAFYSSSRWDPWHPCWGLGSVFFFAGVRTWEGHDARRRAAARFSVSFFFFLVCLDGGWSVIRLWETSLYPAPLRLTGGYYCDVRSYVLLPSGGW